MDPKASPRHLAAESFAHFLGLPARVSKSAAAIPQKVATVARTARTAVTKAVMRKPIACETPFADRLHAIEHRATADATSQAIAQSIAADRKRSHAILAVGLSTGTAAFAAHLAFKTDLTAHEAISAIRAGQEDKAELANTQPLTYTQRTDARIQAFRERGEIN